MTITPSRRLDCTLVEYLPSAADRLAVSAMFATEQLVREVGAESLEAHNAMARERLLRAWADDLETRPPRCAASTRRGARCSRRAGSWRVDHCAQHHGVRIW